MIKQEFVEEMRSRLSGLPAQDVEERLNFYIEMIDDRIEEGYTEEEAVSAIGSVDEIASQIVADIPLPRNAKEKIRPKRRLKAWEIILLVLGSPVWIPLLIAAFVVLISVYIVLWSLIVSIWAVFASLVACAFGGIVAGIAFAFSGNGLVGIALSAASFVCAGLSIFLFFACHAATKGIILLTKKIALSIKRCFVKKEGI